MSKDGLSYTSAAHGRAVVPFTGGLLFVIYAFFWPVEYGTWLGTIVKAFRSAAGI